MADEPVSAWAEPWTRKLSRWLTRHRTGVTRAAAAVLAGVVGLSAVLAVQTRANASLADKNTALEAANAKIEAGASLMAVAGLLEATDKTDEALASFRRSESLLAGPGGADRRARAALAACRSQLGWLLSKTGKSAEDLAAFRLGRPGGAGRRSRSLQRRPPRPGGHHQSHRRRAVGNGQAVAGGGRAPQRCWRSGRSWPTTTPPSPTSASAWRSATYTTAKCCRIRASRRRRRPSFARRLRSTRSWSTTTPPSPTSAATWRGVSVGSPNCCRGRGSQRRRRPNPERRWRSGRSWPTTTPRSPTSANTWRGASAARRTAIEDGQASGDGGRVPQGGGTLAEAG